MNRFHPETIAQIARAWSTPPKPTPEQITTALAYYRKEYGPITREEMEAAANPRRNWHTLAELTALQAAGVDAVSR